MQGGNGLRHSLPPATFCLDHLCCFVCDTVRVIDEHRTKETRIMNIQAVPSTPDNHPAMSLLGTFHCPALLLLIAVGFTIRWLIDERRGHKETGVIRRCNVFSRTINARPIIPVGNVSGRFSIPYVKLSYRGLTKSNRYTQQIFFIFNQRGPVYKMEIIIIYIHLTLQILSLTGAIMKAMINTKLLYPCYFYFSN